jgi:NRAMP (natural resistance-associated macrophage protein)-like metal ion transporter
MPPVSRAGRHSGRRRLFGFGYFAKLGPGLITGASDDDPSGIGTYSQVGAAFRFGLLWTALFTLPLVIAMQELSARLGLVSGKGLARLVKESFPRWTLYVAVALVGVANVFNIGADIGAMGAAVRLLVPLPFVLVVVAVTLGILALEVFLPYRRYAKVLRWLTLSLAAYIAVLFVVGVDWAAALRATLVPSIAWSPVEIAALIAIFGTTISPYLFFWQASEEVEEEHEQASSVPAAPDAAHIRAMRTDVVSGMGSAVVVMWAIMVSTAETLGAHHVTRITTAAQAAQALRPIAGRFASLLFTLGIVGTGLLAVPVLAGSAAYALTEAVGGAEGLDRPLRRAPIFYVVIAGAMLVGLALDFVGIDPVRMLFYAAVLNGLAAPFLILLMLVLSRRREVLGSWRSGPLSVAFVVLTLVIMTGLPIAYLIVR